MKIKIKKSNTFYFRFFLFAGINILEMQRQAADGTRFFRMIWNPYKQPNSKQRVWRLFLGHPWAGANRNVSESCCWRCSASVKAVLTFFFNAMLVMQFT